MIWESAPRGSPDFQGILVPSVLALGLRKSSGAGVWGVGGFGGVGLASKAKTSGLAPSAPF